MLQTLKHPDDAGCVRCVRRLSLSVVSTAQITGRVYDDQRRRDRDGEDEREY